MARALGERARARWRPEERRDMSRRRLLILLSFVVLAELLEHHTVDSDCGEIDGAADEHLERAAPLQQPQPQRRRPRRSLRMLRMRRQRARQRRTLLLGAPRGDPRSAPLARFAVFSDTHFWPPTETRLSWEKKQLSAPARDGLLVVGSEAVLPLLLSQLAAFKESGGRFAIHAGDVVCGGSGFRSPRGEFREALLSYREQLRAVLGEWPVHHLPGNHDISPTSVGNGLNAWRRILANRSTPMNYRAVDAGEEWRVLLLDAVDGLRIDIDGHGYIGSDQLRWLEAQLEETRRLRKQVVLVMHQLLAVPDTSPEGDGGESRPPNPFSWLDIRQDFVQNRLEVLSILGRFSHVRLSLHGHVHANSLTVKQGIAFVSTASVGEYPMHWREVSIYPCHLRLTTHPLAHAALLKQSYTRESRTGRNRIKMGTTLANDVVIHTCGPSPWGDDGAGTPAAVHG